MKLPGPAEILRRSGHRADKRLGQHFLLDPSILDRIVASAGGLDGRTVLEIGPGPGGLTGAILQAGAAHLYAVERDPRWIEALAPLVEAAEGRLTVVPGDALGFDAASLETDGPISVIANLPYNISTPLLFHLLAQRHRFDRLVLMFQKEVAERLAAPPGSDGWGRLAAMTQWSCRVEYLFKLPKGAFSPPPEVESAVVRLTPRSAPEHPCSERRLSTVLAAAFGQRRKMLRQSLKPITPDPVALLDGIGIDPTRRAETLGLADFARISNALDGA
ncbi:16S rRNA (adenine(1518)-N(6)/adenine(1519)-N(6))-dimethyltransferase RsmA [Geminicoccus roseus]|uniref:16S rRNA (adenine(1518)-N(6)/adenine(1519)-N(6))- dimethyltransferase RsmA n=1 Tax=Geminicoccus roseus TaxID=404900 RepID=UPI000403D64D|nr:16S rRNA (adenine(1518)-N(6)/adenine(1519)-N(6))-dimethyltransferase RsmA [Geminicoccus roseus]